MRDSFNTFRCPFVCYGAVLALLMSVHTRLKSPPRVSLLTAICIVVANMIGTGIFTSLGFQVGDLPSGFAIVALWTVGGICAMCGALSYAELGAALPRSGGEYHFLREIYHPAVGFVAGWISATVGFAAPVAIAAMPFGTYLAEIVPGVNPLLAALAAVWITTLVLLCDLRLGGTFQVGSTILKVVLIGVLILAGLLVKKTQPVSFLPVKGDGALILSAPFAVSLYWVMYAYSGWNASTYISGEIRAPQRNVPLSLGLGTILVSGLYILVNVAFMRTTPAAEMVGKQQVALIAGAHIFGATGGKIVASFICLGLISTVSAMMWIGPRVTATMGEDLRALRWLSRRSARGVPARAILLQWAIVNVMLLTATFQNVVNYVQFSLQLCSALTVLGLFVLRWRRPNLERPFRAWGYPVTPLIFLVVSGWMLWHLLADPSTRMPSFLGLATALSGLVFYLVSPKNNEDRDAAISC
jgi:basic amino acid/polyamine antiporter, APA family